jgi:hypothetical protein
MDPDPASLGQPLRQASSGELHPSRMSRRVLGSPQGTCCVLRSALWPRKREGRRASNLVPLPLR